MSAPGQAQSYLMPYLDAARRHGEGFQSLLWATPATQAKRFGALARLCDFRAITLLDAGCGRADLLDFLVERRQAPAHYIGVEAIAELARAAERKAAPMAGPSACPTVQIIEADFVRQPARLAAGADAIAFSGSLNTLSPPDFFRTLEVAFEAARHCVVFNFLASRKLAGVDWLTWHEKRKVLAFARQLTPEVRVLDDYIQGDCSVLMCRPDAGCGSAHPATPLATADQNPSGRAKRR
jgi:SAM-dependent methyltransferase